MFRKIRASFLSSMIIAVLVMSAVGPTVAYADGENPPETPPAETSSDECNSSENSECPADAEAPAEEAVSEGNSDAKTDKCSPPKDASGKVKKKNKKKCLAVPPASESNAEAAPVADVAPAEETAPAESLPPAEPVDLSTVPENTSVEVVNADGEPEPLATKEAAAAIAESDPIWCPEGQDATPGQNGCTDSFNSFDALLKFLSGNSNYSGAGTIYVQQGDYKGGESSIDLTSSDYDLSNINKSNLTITGGWNTSNNTIDPAKPSSFNVPIIIGSGTNPWGGSLTLNNISIDKASGNALTLHSQSDINLTNVSVTNTANGIGADLNAGGNVTIEDSNFVRNKITGAKIKAEGSVAISDSNFSNPISGRQRLQIKGLEIESGQSVSLFNVLANGNREVGANITAGDRVTIVQSVFSGTKTINNGAFLGYGLKVTTPGIIDLDTVTANDNFLWGAMLDAGSDVNIIKSNFNENTTESPGFIDDTGLLVSSGGNVSLQEVQANDNRLVGATIDATGDVSISNSSFSRNNGVLTNTGSPTFYGYGLQVTTDGNIFINMVRASDNTLYGARLDAGADVIVSNSDFSNQTTGSDTDKIGRGLEVVSGGSVFLDNVTLNNNQTFGANIQAASDVFLDTVTATNNGTDGVVVQGACVHLFGGTYSGNGQYGLNLGTSPLDQVSQPVFGNNGAGDIFPVSPASCSPTANNPPTTTNNPAPATGTGSSTLASGAGNLNIFAGSANYGMVNLNSFLANTRMGNSSGYGIFIGKYVYVHSLTGLEIFALVPKMQYVAMSGS